MREAAEELKVTRAFLYKMMNKGSLPFLDGPEGVGKLISVEALAELMERECYREFLARAAAFAARLRNRPHAADCGFGEDPNHQCLLSTRQAARIFNTGLSTLSQYARAGRLRAIFKGSSRYFLLEDLEAVYGRPEGRKRGAHTAISEGMAQAKKEGGRPRRPSRTKG